MKPEERELKSALIRSVVTKNLNYDSKVFMKWNFADPPE
jgi:hypothetical protein